MLFGGVALGLGLEGGALKNGMSYPHKRPQFPLVLRSYPCANTPVCNFREDGLGLVLFPVFLQLPSLILAFSPFFSPTKYKTARLHLTVPYCRTIDYISAV